MNPFFYPYKGGIERRMADTSRLLAAKGHDVTVLTGRLSEDSPEEETMDGYRIVRLKSRQIRVYNPPFISSKGVLEALGSLDADLVNFNYRWAPSYTKDLRKYDGKKVFTYHNMWGEGVGLMGRFSEMNDDRFAPTLETFDHVIAVSDYVRKDLLRRGYSARYVTAVPTCLQTPVEPGEGKGDYILSLGRHVKTKGLEYLVEAMRDVDHRLVICGKGPEDRRLKRLISKYGLEDRIEMKGYVTDEEKHTLMGDCRFFVMPSVFESLGLAAEELMSRGRPIVCSDADGLPDTVGDAGVVVPKRDPKALADAMNALFDDVRRCEALAAKAAERASYYDWNNHLPTIEDVYSKVLSGEYTEADAHASGGDAE
ncbi:glycosyltransferase family 4 protein [Methanomethylophilus alvi]|uniref:glycosyltransferase family 4 protein n=1 Tax=Methanomethylophilus alvi TaxID=1291540 RepID=UPI0037DD8130